MSSFVDFFTEYSGKMTWHQMQADWFSCRPLPRFALSPQKVIRSLMESPNRSCTQYGWKETCQKGKKKKNYFQDFPKTFIITTPPCTMLAKFANFSASFGCLATTITILKILHNLAQIILYAFECRTAKLDFRI